MSAHQLPDSDAPAIYLSAYLTERDVAPADVRRNKDGDYIVRALGREVAVGAPADGHTILWALQAADEVVGELGNRMLSR